MGILGNIFGAPLLGPIQGVLWLARTVAEQAKAELCDEDGIRGQLADLELALDLKQIGSAEYDAREEALLRRLREVREAKDG